MSALHPAINKSRVLNAYHAFIVQPVGDFNPANWQGVPQSYRIVEYVGQKKHRGDADAWRFLHNRQAISDASLNRWAIVVPQKTASVKSPMSDSPAPGTGHAHAAAVSTGPNGCREINSPLAAEAVGV